MTGGPAAIAVAVCGVLVGCTCGSTPPLEDAELRDVPSDVIVDPSRRWVQISANGDDVCAVRADGRSACWGGHYPGGRVLEPVLETVHAGGAVRTCGLEPGGEIWCGLTGFGSPSPEWVPPAGAFVTFDLLGDEACAVRVDGLASCWFNGRPGTAGPVFSPPTTERIAQVSIDGIACAVTDSGNGVCWNPTDDADVPAQPPPAALVSIERDGARTYYLQEDGEVGVFPAPLPYLLAPPGPFVELAVGRPNCALRADGEAVCWGDSWLPDAASEGIAALQPDERYAHIACGHGFVCGILLDGRRSCWGSNPSGALTPPELP